MKTELKRTMQSFIACDAYFISPEGTVIPVESRHIDVIVKFPYRFGLDPKHVQAIHDKHGETLDSEASARAELLIGLFLKGWIRVRFYHGFYKRNRHELHFELNKLSRKTKEFINDFLAKVAEGQIQSGEFVIKNPDVYILSADNGESARFLMNGTLKDIVGKLYESKKLKLKFEILQ